MHFFSTHVSSVFYSQIAKTFFAALMVFLIYSMFNLLSRRIQRKRMRERFKMRLFYVMTFVFLVLLVHIWLRGFGTIFTVIGVAIAAIIITNKESIMNFTGFLIIQWRELFTEGDHIEIGTVNGEVRNIGILYITVLEYVPSSDNFSTGRIIRIPNAQVITGQVVNYSQTSHFLSYNVQLVITFESEIEFALKLIEESINKVLRNYYANKAEYSQEYLSRKDKRYLALVNWEPFLTIGFHQEKPFGIKITANYHCYSIDQLHIEREIYLTLIPALQQQNKVQLARST